MTVFAPQASLNFGDLGGFVGSQFRCDHFAPQASLIFGDFWGEWRGMEGRRAGVEGSQFWL